MWLIYCIVISSSYAGNLMAFMTTPSLTSPIDTLKQVLDSGLSWAMVLYGEEEEEMMQKSTDPVIKRIWDEKMVEEYAPSPKVSNDALSSARSFNVWTGRVQGITLQYPMDLGNSGNVYMGILGYTLKMSDRHSKNFALT